MNIKVRLRGCTGMLEESIKNLHASGISFALNSIGGYQFKKVEFKGIFSKLQSVSFLPKKVVSLCIL